MIMDYVELHKGMRDYWCRSTNEDWHKAEGNEWRWCWNKERKKR